MTTFLPCRELISFLVFQNAVTAMNFVTLRDMLVSIVERKMKQSFERKGSSNLKDNLLKDVYNLYLFGERSIQSLPKNMIKCDIKYMNQSPETDACLSNTSFVSKLDLDTLKDELMNRISDLRQEMLNINLPSRSPVPISCFLPIRNQPLLIPCPLPSLNQLLSLKTANFLHSPVTLSISPSAT